MIFTYEDKNLDLTKITRLYPAALVEVPNEDPAQVSLEWAELKADKINLIGYVLIFDFDPMGEPPVNRVELRFDTREQLDSVIFEVAQQLKFLKQKN